MVAGIRTDSLHRCVVEKRSEESRVRGYSSWSLRVFECESEGIRER